MDKKIVQIEFTEIVELEKENLINLCLRSHQQRKKLSNNIPENLRNQSLTYNLIKSVLRDFTIEQESYYPISINLIPLLGLLHHMQSQLIEDFILDMDCKGTQQQLFWEMLSDYQYFYKNSVENYLKSRIIKEDSIIKIEHLNKNDLNFLNLSKSILAESSFKKESTINAFYILIFFDLYAILADKNNKADKPKVAMFCLQILPHLIGEYRFGSFHKQLKDKSFSILDEDLYEKTKLEISSCTPNTKSRENLVKELRGIFSNANLHVEIKSRVKGVCSAFLKSVKYDRPVEKLWDLFALRIIVLSDNISDCYKVLSYLDSKWKRWNNKKGYFDYIQNSKANGYKSVHVVYMIDETLVEIQVRTKRMDFQAEFGLASHLSVYKANESNLNLSELAITDVEKGKATLEQFLSSRNLTLDDFILHLSKLGNVLDYVPIEHYYEGIETGKYDVEALVSQIRVGFDNES